MKKALVWMANGFEEIEALTAVDLLRRAGVQVDMVSIEPQLEVEGSHGIRVRANLLLGEVRDFDGYDAVITPGGMPGSAALRDTPAVTEMLASFYGKEGKTVGSICASPIALGRAGVAQHIAGTCYPGFEHEAGFREYRKSPVVVDGNVVTAIGPAAAFPFALALVERIVGKETADRLREGTMWNAASQNINNI